MPRVKLLLPEKFSSFSVQIPVRITDINYGNHVGNDSLVSIIHEARVQFLQHHNYTELNIEGVGLILGDLSVEFKNESFYKEIIAVKIAVGDFTRVSFELFYKLSVIRNEKEILIANAKTTMVCYDYQSKKISAVSERLKSILNN